MLSIFWWFELHFFSARSWFSIALTLSTTKTICKTVKTRKPFHSRKPKNWVLITIYRVMDSGLCFYLKARIANSVSKVEIGVTGALKRRIKKLGSETTALENTWLLILWWTVWWIWVEDSYPPYPEIVHHRAEERYTKISTKEEERELHIYPKTKTKTEFNYIAKAKTLIAKE